MDDDAFVRHVGDRLAGLPGVEAVTLGGSRAEGTNRPDSDWDFSLHYRDLDVVDREGAAAREGRFTIQPLRFHLAGLPSYIVLAELAVKRVLAGDLPDVSYPAALRERAPGAWWGQAEAELGYARDYHAAGGRLT